MHLRMDGQPWLLHVAVWTCVAVFVVSFLAALAGNILVLAGTDGLAAKPGELGLSWGEQAGRRFGRVGSFLMADEFRALRRLSLAAWAGAAGSFCLLLLIVAVFGERG